MTDQSVKDIISKISFDEFLKIKIELITNQHLDKVLKQKKTSLNKNYEIYGMSAIRKYLLEKHNIKYTISTLYKKKSLGEIPIESFNNKPFAETDKIDEWVNAGTPNWSLHISGYTHTPKVQIYDQHLNTHGIESGESIFENLDTDSMRKHIKSIQAKSSFDLDKSYVYVLINKKTKLYKIGKSINVKKRVNSINTQSGGGVKLLLSAETGVNAGIEAEIIERFILHLRFASKNKIGEWFDLSYSDLSEIKKFLQYLSEDVFISDELFNR